MTDDNTNDLGSFPSWYEEIFPAGPSDGFYQKFGNHSMMFVNRGQGQLVVTLDNLSDAGNPRYDREAWAGKFCRDNGWSHLGIFSQGPTWYRDMGIIQALEALRDRGFFSEFDRVAWSGTSMGGFGAATFCSLAPGSTVVAFSPQTTLDIEVIPWEYRFHKGQAQDWTLPYSDAADHTAQAGRVYAIYDPMLKEDALHINRLPQSNVMHLKGIGLGHRSALILRRMEQLKPVMAGCVTGTITQAEFRDRIADRKTLYAYRRNMESYLERRKTDTLALRFRQAFRAGRRAEMATNPPADDPVDPAPAVAATHAEGANAVVTKKTHGSAGGPQGGLPVSQVPSYPGNAWMVTAHSDGTITYLSDRWRGRTIGFVERDDETQVQSGPLALGILAVGGGCAVERDHLSAFDWHVLDHNLSRHTPRLKAQAQGEVFHALRDQTHGEHPWAICITANQPSTVPQDVDAALVASVLKDLEQAQDRVQGWGKILFVDRIGLDLLSGAAETQEDETHLHYMHTAVSLQSAVSDITGQTSAPAIVVSQSAGTQVSGRSPVILAEGRLDIENPMSGFVVATPRYPYDLMPDMPATHTPQAAAVVDALEVLAVDAVQTGQPWHCPILLSAVQDGAQIRAEFSALSELVLGEGPHGFALNGADDVTISQVAPSGTEVVLTLSDIPNDRPLWLTYAWGQDGEMGTGRAANQGSLRDSYAMPCPWDTSITLHRYALSARVRVTGA